MNEKKKLFSKNFVLLLFGQTSSLFANMILRFALSMYILDVTGSAGIFAGLLAAAMIPTILLSPFGGILADRANRRNVMVTLDFLSGITALLTLMVIGDANAVPVAGCVLVVLSVLGAFESPTVQAAVPQMQEGENIIRANAAVNQVASLAALIAPFLGSACYTVFGLKSVLAVSAVGFLFTAALEGFIRLPYDGVGMEEGFVKTVRDDFRVSIRFITREKPEILKMLLSVAAVGFFIMGVGNVGLPYMIRTVLGLNAEYAGAAESVCGAAAILGSVVVGVAAGKLRAGQMYKLLAAIGICVIPMGMAFLVGNAVGSYLVMVVFIAVIQLLASVFSIYCLSLIQTQTPGKLLGKVMAYISTITLCAQPLGQVLYGVLFDALPGREPWILYGTAFFILLFSLPAKRSFAELEDRSIIDSEETCG